MRREVRGLLYSTKGATNDGPRRRYAAWIGCSKTLIRRWSNIPGRGPQWFKESDQTRPQAVSMLVLSEASTDVGDELGKKRKAIRSTRYFQTIVVQCLSDSPFHEGVIRDAAL